MEFVKERILARVDHFIEKGEAVLSTHRENPPGVIGFPTLNNELFYGWKTGVESFLVNVVGAGHTYCANFKDKVKQAFTSHVEVGLGILKAVREDVEGGYLLDVKVLLAAEVFTDFLEIAKHLIDMGYKDPAAFLTTAVLENGLKRMCERAGISVRAKEDLASLNAKLADREVYSRLVQKKVQVWVDIRNKADHGEFDQYTLNDVKELHRGVSEFLSQRLS
jgi:hypothetical protein